MLLSESTPRRAGPRSFEEIRIKEKSGSDKYLYVMDQRGLVAATQMSVLELHLWGSRVDDVEKPDRMVFDLDPDEGLDFVHVKEAAKELKERLADVGSEIVSDGDGRQGRSRRRAAAAPAIPGTNTANFPKRWHA